jgi:hypothetical protein
MLYPEMANKEQDSLSTYSSDSETDEDKEILGMSYVCIYIYRW